MVRPAPAPSGPMPAPDLDVVSLDSLGEIGPWFHSEARPPRLDRGNLFLLACREAARDGQIDRRENRILGRLCHALQIPRETAAALCKQAVLEQKAGKLSPGPAMRPKALYEKARRLATSSGEVEVEEQEILLLLGRLLGARPTRRTRAARVGNDTDPSFPGPLSGAEEAISLPVPEVDPDEPETQERPTSPRPLATYEPPAEEPPATAGSAEPPMPGRLARVRCPRSSRPLKMARAQVGGVAAVGYGFSCLLALGVLALSLGHPPLDCFLRAALLSVFPLGALGATRWLRDRARARARALELGGVAPRVDEVDPSLTIHPAEVLVGAVLLLAVWVAPAAAMLGHAV